MNKYKKEIKTPSVNLKLRYDGVVEMLPREDFTGAHTLKHAKENEFAGMALLNDKPTAFVIVLGDQYIEDDARLYYASAKPVAAAGLVVGSFAQTVMGNIFLKIKQMAIPMKLFTNKEKALEWVQQFVDKNALEDK